jgi:uncharacterized membrane protein
MVVAPDGQAHCAACEAPPFDRSTPGKVIVVGLVLTLLGLFWVGATYKFAGKVMIFPFAFLIAGLFALVKGVQLKRLR